ncbi:hypothetical protein K437DRAFT_260057 [Tilletiaria anomala UBC 951]|uniref:Transcriptional regulator n=1 Tax=Tilletiaria anomala (strain ATCC 24038 / CBS 436.72 / UBC 951) TaxID=1037660 RepID=A0A066V5A3_TILAU|nr:uncharacterized protein K437DRAFT_260057 [Tilletiaria anomala UBC 951]KDN36666.1 hypothetical protein K437DRAFT_260057 [Tilletiaria anomala UBC 951]
MASDENDGNNLAWLEGHLTCANPHAKALLEASKASKDGSVPAQQVSMLFMHTSQSYISLQYYTFSKPSTGKAVPTWNYAAAQVTGQLFVDESPTFVPKQVNDLTDDHEGRLHQQQ